MPLQAVRVTGVPKRVVVLMKVETPNIWVVKHSSPDSTKRNVYSKLTDAYKCYQYTPSFLLTNAYMRVSMEVSEPESDCFERKTTGGTPFREAGST